MARRNPLPIIEIDINARVVGDNEPIFVLFPGEKYTLFNTIKNRQVLTLEFPGLDLGSARRVGEISDLKERIAMATKIRSWHRAGVNRGDEPSRDPRDYSGFSMTEARALYIGAVESVFFDIKPGTIVVVPGPGHWGEILIGEVAGGRTTVFDRVNYPGEQLPARRVRWLAQRPKSDFSEEFVRHLPTPNPFTMLAREFHEEVLTAAFENVVYKDRIISKFSTTKQSFNSLDAYRIQMFLNFISGAFIASEEDGVREKFKVDFEKALEFLTENPDLVPELTLNINSPGFLKMLSEGLAPLVVASFLALALAGCDDIKPEQVKVVNSAKSSSQDCTVQVAESVKDIFTFIDYESWSALCKEARAAARDTGLSTTTTAYKTAEPKPARSKP